jgi:ornithine cyclodeaminase/alanine dehydrogenase-like protein (mu-crystallin family)
MPLLITEDEVQELFAMERALERVEASLRAQHDGQGVNRPRQRIFIPGTTLHYMAAALPGDNLLGLKIYTVTRRGYCFVVLLFEAESGKLLAIIEADHLGRLRTGAASGVATRHMARLEASRVGLVGTGRQARTQLEAVAKVRKISAAWVFSRSEERRRDFCREMSARLNLDVAPAESPEAVVRFGEIIITATNSAQPVVEGAWLRPGVHLNAIGSNMANRREVDAAALARSGVLAVDSLEQAQLEAGDLIHGLPAGPEGWERVIELHEIVAGARPGRRQADEITLFKSCGIALWDVAAAGAIYHRARAQGKGKEFPLGEG